MRISQIENLSYGCSLLSVDWVRAITAPWPKLYHEISICNTNEFIQPRSGFTNPEADPKFSTIIRSGTSSWSAMLLSTLIPCFRYFISLDFVAPNVTGGWLHPSFGLMRSSVQLFLKISTMSYVLCPYVLCTHLYSALCAMYYASTYFYLMYFVPWAMHYAAICYVLTCTLHYALCTMPLRTMYLSYLHSTCLNANTYYPFWC